LSSDTVDESMLERNSGIKIQKRVEWLYRCSQCVYTNAWAQFQITQKSIALWYLSGMFLPKSKSNWTRKNEEMERIMARCNHLCTLSCRWLNFLFLCILWRAKNTATLIHFSVISPHPPIEATRQENYGNCCDLSPGPGHVLLL